MTVPIIGIVGDRKPVSFGSWREVSFDGLPHSYVAAVTAAGGLPLMIPCTEAGLREADRFTGLVDGLFLPGGRDLDAELYGERAHPENDETVRVRDELEIALVLSARRRRMPVLGACRGMQVLNVALGGTLEQHLADRLDQTPHRDRVGTFTSHPVTVERGTVLSSILSAQRFDIASHHHQAVAGLGAGLRASAHADDGVVEAVEGIDGRFLVGVQWHPEERLEPHGAELMGAFVGAAREHARTRRSPQTVRL